jgi:hypothetical protein
MEATYFTPHNNHCLRSMQPLLVRQVIFHTNSVCHGLSNPVPAATQCFICEIKGNLFGNIDSNMFSEQNIFHWTIDRPSLFALEKVMKDEGMRWKCTVVRYSVATFNVRLLLGYSKSNTKPHCTINEPIASPRPIHSLPDSESLGHSIR